MLIATAPDLIKEGQFSKSNAGSLGGGGEGLRSLARCPDFVRVFQVEMLYCFVVPSFRSFVSSFRSVVSWFHGLQAADYV